MYYIGDMVHWIESGADLETKTLTGHVCWGTILEMDDSYCDGIRRAYVTKNYFDLATHDVLGGHEASHRIDGTRILVEYATLTADQVTPPGEFHKLIIVKKGN